MSGDDVTCVWCILFLIALGNFGALFFTANLDVFPFVAPAALLGTVLIGAVFYVVNHVDDILSPHERSSTGGLKWAIFWFNADSKSELPLSEDEIVMLILTKFGIREKLARDARVAYFYGRDVSMVEKAPSGDLTPMERVAVSLALKVGMSDEDYDRFSRVRFFDHPDFQGFVAC